MKDQRPIGGGGVSRYQECFSDFGEEWHPVDVEGNIYHGSHQFLLVDDLTRLRYCRSSKSAAYIVDARGCKVSRMSKSVSCMNSVYLSNLKNLFAADIVRHEVKAN